jgi:hypothetical protein
LESPRSGHPNLFDPAFIHVINPIGKVEPAVIMGHANDDLATCLEVRQNLLVEDTAEVRVLIGGPLVEDQDRLGLK